MIDFVKVTCGTLLQYYIDAFLKYNSIKNAAKKWESYNLSEANAE